MFVNVVRVDMQVAGMKDDAECEAARKEVEGKATEGMC